jgi:hypothetical protein
MANETSTTQRTKAVIADWSDQPQDSITLDTKLSRLRDNHLDSLRDKLNREFRGEGTFPITQKEWEQAGPKTVRNVRDLVRKKLGEE